MNVGGKEGWKKVIEGDEGVKGGEEEERGRNRDEIEKEGDREGCK